MYQNVKQNIKMDQNCPEGSGNMRIWSKCCLQDHPNGSGITRFWFSLDTTFLTINNKGSYCQEYTEN